MHFVALSSQICPAGSPSDCRLTIINQSGYSAKDLIRVYNGHEVRRITDKHSCPADYKIWSPRSKADWAIVYNAMGQDIGNYPSNPYLIIDVTRSVTPSPYPDPSPNPNPCPSASLCTVGP